jgi:prepilin-type N-terminal cleavage/methylation domain-containing protein
VSSGHAILLTIMKNLWRLQKVSGFTLIEVLVVTSIIAILSSVVLINALDSSEKSRDAERQGDLRSVQSAIELYKHKNGRYPAQCAGGSDGWTGQIGTSYACNDGTNRYIVDLAPEFISVLPVDLKLNGANSGYVYRTNGAGTVYKLMAMSTVESDTLHDEHEFRSCDYDASQAGSGDILKAGWCIDTVLPAPSGNTPLVCLPTNTRYQNSYAVWGGQAPLFANRTSLEGRTVSQMRTDVQNTTAVICQ